MLYIFDYGHKDIQMDIKPINNTIYDYMFINDY